MKLITYSYLNGDGHVHQALRNGSDAEDFVGNATSHGRQIISVEDAPDTTS